MKERTNHPMKQFPFIGACGLDCGLCPRFNSNAASRCPGCCGEGFLERHPSCAFITCCVKQKGLEACGECREYKSCPRVLRNIEAAKACDSFLSYQTLPGNLEFIEKNGTRALAERLRDKMGLLRRLLEDYDDGHNKGFYCLCVQLLPLDKLKSSLTLAREQLSSSVAPENQAKAMRTRLEKLAEEEGIKLALRKNKPL